MTSKFLISDGKLDRKIETPKSLRLGALFDAYLAAIPSGSLEDSTLRSIAIHRAHLEKHLGKRFWVRGLKRGDLQSYVSKRSLEPGLRGTTVGATTIKKELSTLRTVWRWAMSEKFVEGSFPNVGLRFPKTKEKRQFQTFDEISETVSGRKLTPGQELELWECLFLSTKEIEELLEHVRCNAWRDFVYPMFVMAAHTGARRSELLRSEKCDIGTKFVTIRETKRVRGQRSTRRVPLSPILREALDSWMKIHPGGPFTFCMESNEGTPLTKGQASDYFKRTLAKSRWSVVPGWHCFRHSFCSNCAMEGIDQRLIDSWVGHTTESMRRRYRHLFPSHEIESLASVFAERG